MTWIVHRVIALAWGLWFGGLIVLFMSVTSVFATLAPDRHAAGNITAPIFHRFEIYQLILAAVLVVAAAMARVFGGRGRARSAFLGMVLGAAVLAVVNTVAITPVIERGRVSGQTQTDEFRHAHEASMSLFLLETIVIGAAGLLLPGVIATSGATVAAALERSPATVG